MESIYNQENELFREWKKELPDKYKFVPDGVVSEASGKVSENNKEYQFKGWNDSTCKIIFLLKEVNDDKNKYASHREYLCKKWDLRKFINDGAIREKNNERKNKLTWGNISRWTYGINELFKFGNIPDWEIAKKRGNKVGRLIHLKSICAINLNKQPGSSKTDNNKLKDYFAKYNKTFLAKQLSIYSDTNIIICCGKIVKDLLLDSFFEIFEEKYNQSHVVIVNNVWTYQLKRGPIIIGFNHPQQRNKTNEYLYTNLLYSIKEKIK